MIGLLLAIKVLAIVFGGWSGLEGDGDWGKVPATVHMIIFSLVYHDLAPIVCAYLRGDLQRIRASVVLGIVVSLPALLVWDAVALGLSAHDDQVSDPVKLLLRYFNHSTICYIGNSTDIEITTKPTTKNQCLCSTACRENER
ncbi:hypothetical protein LOK49_LG11G00854 [Camellia lanceoleosa]|uniref:Uncharacterized protein n=1 Tax=Camellia lanceoleosa TaxID=1840588 RepID=A0ACC0G048_9ERIC|nr:hypothetical protein LOK49_LG11G00854 [Camellia lanceoleosa]